MDLATQLLSIIPYMNYFEFSLFDYANYDNMTTCAYILSYVARFDKEKFISFVPLLIAHKKAIEYEAAYTAALIIFYTLQKFHIKYGNLEQLVYYVKNNQDTYDSPDLCTLF